jgi:hypothetical protein
MMIAPLFLALQAASPSAMLDPEFLKADDAWLHCRDLRLGEAVVAGKKGKKAVAAAFAGCSREETALRAILVARLGAAEGGATMERIRGFSRQMMLRRLQGRGW